MDSKSEDATDEHPRAPMSEERRQWLAEAFAAMAENDPVKKMLENIQILLNAETPREAKEEALDILQEYCEDIDLANDFHKLGGCHILPTLLESESEGLRWRTGELIAALTQNNPVSQLAILEAGLLPRLLRKIDSEHETELVRVKSLFAVSCLVRGNPEAEAEFLRRDGYSVLKRAMQTDIDKLRLKAMFTISSLSHDRPDIKDFLCDMGMIEQLVALLHCDHSAFHEHLFSTLLGIVANNARAQAECHRPEFRLRELLDERKQLLQDRPEFQEELEHVNELSKILRFTSDSDNAAADNNFR
jgi:hsp70-interacting protein